MIEKRPYWQDPSIEAQESKLVEEGKVAKFSPLTELPIAFSSWGYDTPMDAAPVFVLINFLMALVKNSYCHITGALQMAS